MDSLAHARAKELFLAACEQAKQERTGFLDRHCGDDVELRREVESLLACYDEVMVEGVAAPTRALDDGRPAQERTIGNYRLLERLGEGGMGEVYEAEQERPMRRRVALKLIKWGMDTKEVVARFESERQALALMDHPNIARVLDGGATEGGRPYFVMEFVKGVPITEYCDTYRLTTVRRLELFLQVCDGVQHAHQKGIIHRDIKPSNVLVTIHDDAPVPKIIDFGIAKATDQRLTERTVHTELGRVIGTPAYMSPEQAELDRLDVDTRTDVYSLGVLLYELLVGALPFEPSEAGFDEMRRRIREEEPARPSVRLTGPGEVSRQSAAKRDTDVGSLARMLRGDLDWIVMKALEKDRTRRYASPSELAADIRRHLDDEPVLAGPPSRSYRLKKFVRRNRVGVVAAAVVVLAVALGVAGLSVGLAEAVRARDIARQESAAAAEVADFLAGLFEVSDPGTARGDTITARELLDRGAERIERELADQPVVKARMMATMGSVYRGLGIYERAQQLLEKALALREENLGPEDAALVDNLFDLAWVVSLRGDPERGKQLAERCFALCARVFDEDHPKWPKLMTGEAVLLRQEGRHDEAEALLRDAVARWEAMPGHAEPFYGYALDELAYMLAGRGELHEARELAERGLRFREEALGPDHPTIAAGLDALATVLVDGGDLDGARELYERVLAIEERTLGSRHPDLIDTLIELGALRYRAGDRESAMPLYRRALEIGRSTFGETNPAFVRTLYDLALGFERAGDETLGRRYFEQALEIVESNPEIDYPGKARLINDYGNLLHRRGRPDEARVYYDRALAIVQAANGIDDPLMPVIAANIAGVLADRNEWEEALPFFRLNLESRERLHPPGHLRIAWAQNALGYALLRLGELEESRSRLERALEAMEALHGPDHVDTAWVEHNVGLLLAREGDDGRARERFERALRIVERDLGPEHLRVAWGLYGVSGVHYRAGEYDEAKARHERALAIQEKVLGLEHAETARNTYNLACLNALIGERKRALENLRLARDRGFSWDGIAEDGDLASLRGDPEFEGLVAEILGRN